MHSSPIRRILATGLTAAGMAVAVSSTRVEAQLTPSAVGGAVWELYDFATEEAANMQRISLLTVPLSVHVPLAEVANLQLRGNFARGQLVRADGSELTVSGPTDTELRLGFNLGSPRRSTATLTAIALLPTGNSTHTLDEAEVAGVIAADLLPFRITHWGSGGGFGASVAAASALPRGSIGASAAYLVGREFEPIETAGQSPFVYRPGNQLQFRAALDQTVGTTGKLTVSVAVQHHADDAQAGTNLYRAGTRFHGMGSYAFPAGARSSALVYVGGLHRNRGTPLDERLIPAPSQDLFLAGAGLRIPAGQGVLAPSVDARLHRSEDGVGQGFLVGVGSSLEWPTGAAVLIPNARFRAGHLLVREGVETRILGLELGLTARLGRR